MILAEALSHYLGSFAPTLPPPAHRELHRFARTVGMERSVEALSPPEVERYAQEVVAAGGDVQDRLNPVKSFLSYLHKQGLASQRLHPHIKIPRSSVRASTTTEAPETIAMSQESIALLREELAALKAQRVEKADAIRAAAADKDFRENAPLDAAREEQGKAEARIRELEETLRRAVVMDQQKDGSKGASVGATIVLQDTAVGKKCRYCLVDAAQVDPSAGRISVESPMGRALVGARDGQEVAVQTPKGERHYRVVSVQF